MTNNSESISVEKVGSFAINLSLVGCDFEKVFAPEVNNTYKVEFVICCSGKCLDLDLNFGQQNLKIAKETTCSKKLVLITYDEVFLDVLLDSRLVYKKLIVPLLYSGKLTLTGVLYSGTLCVKDAKVNNNRFRVVNGKSITITNTTKAKELEMLTARADKAIVPKMPILLYVEQYGGQLSLDYHFEGGGWCGWGIIFSEKSNKITIFFDYHVTGIWDSSRRTWFNSLYDLPRTFFLNLLATKTTFELTVVDKKYTVPKGSDSFVTRDINKVLATNTCGNGTYNLVLL